MSRTIRLRTLPVLVGMFALLTIYLALQYIDVSHLDRDYTKYEYFHGPARVPRIPEEDFVEPKNDGKYFIYDCSAPLCGGLGDRQEGIVAAYLISQMMGRRFGMRMMIPCNVSQFLDENREPWMLNKGIPGAESAQIFNVLDAGAWRVRETIHIGSLEDMFRNDVVFFLVNQEFVQYLKKLPRFHDLVWARNRTVPEIYNIVLRRLFKLKPKQQEIFDNFQTSVRQNGRELVCAHIRLHTMDPNNYQYDKNALGYVQKIWRFLKIYNDPSMYRIFVATNSERIRSEAKEMFPDTLVDVEGPIIHVDLDVGEKNSCEGLGKSLVDQMILSTCDISFVSDSGFSRVAAMLRGTDERMFGLKGRSRYSDANFIPPYW